MRVQASLGSRFHVLTTTQLPQARQAGNRERGRREARGAQEAGSGALPHFAHAHTHAHSPAPSHPQYNNICDMSEALTAAHDAEKAQRKAKKAKTAGAGAAST